MSTDHDSTDDSTKSGGYVDLQVNGYAGADFNSDVVTLDQIAAACRRLEADNVRGILATIITDDLNAMARRLGTIVRARQQDPLIAKIIVGIHIEGPFLNSAPGYIGAHPVDEARSAEPDAMKRLLDAAEGLARIVTLAPECDPDFATTRMLADTGITVAAGHCDPSLDQLRAAIDAGLSMFTHLGNGCPGALPRHDNIIQRVLSLAGPLTISFVADGAHVPPFALKNYLAVAGIGNCVVVTDAISAAGLGPGTYSLGDQRIEIGQDLIPWSADRTHFVGSATTMPRMATVLDGIGLAEDEISQLLATNPGRFLH